MKNILTKLKTLAIAGITMGLAFQAQAETVDYNLRLQDGVAYTNKIDKACVFTEGAKALGLSYDANTDVWTMKNFNFTTTAYRALSLTSYPNCTFTVIGNCRIATTNTNGPDVIRSWGNVTFNGADSGVNTLTITAPDDKSGDGEAHGIFFDSKCSISIGDNVTVTFDVGRDVTAVSSFDALSVSGNGKLIAKTEGGDKMYAICGEEEPDAAAMNNADGSTPVWIWVVQEKDYQAGTYANIVGGVTNIATNVTLTAKAPVIDYTLVLTNGVAYKSADGGKTLGDVITPEGLSYADSVWTMSNFVFKTTAVCGIQVLGDDCVTIRLDGDNAVTSGDAKDGSRNNPSAIEFKCDAKIVGVGTLTAAGGRYDADSTVQLYGIRAEKSLTIQDATVVAKGGTDGTASGASKFWQSTGIAVEGAFDVIDADVTIMAFPTGKPDSSWGLSFSDSVRVTGSGKVSVTANDYAVALSDSPTGTEPDATARDFEGHNLTWVAVGYAGAYLQYGSESAFATNVVLTAKPSVPIEAKPTAAPDHATIAAVLTNGVEAAEIAGKAGYYPAWSNGTAVVVYKADAGWCFKNGQTVVTNALDTSVNPAVNKAGELPGDLAKPSVQLGVVAQRYPWNGTLDVGYRATYVKDAPATLTVTIPGMDPITREITISSGTNSVSVNLPAEIKAKGAKVTLKLK